MIERSLTRPKNGMPDSWRRSNGSNNNNGSSKKNKRNIVRRTGDFITRRVGGGVTAVYRKLHGTVTAVGSRLQPVVDRFGVPAVSLLLASALLWAVHRPLIAQVALMWELLQEGLGSIQDRRSSSSSSSRRSVVPVQKHQPQLHKPEFHKHSLLDVLTNTFNAQQQQLQEKSSTAAASWFSRGRSSSSSSNANNRGGSSSSSTSSDSYRGSYDDRSPLSWAGKARNINNNNNARNSLDINYDSRGHGKVDLVLLEKARQLSFLDRIRLNTEIFFRKFK